MTEWALVEEQHLQEVRRDEKATDDIAWWLEIGNMLFAPPPDEQTENSDSDDPGEAAQL